MIYPDLLFLEKGFDELHAEKITEEAEKFTADDKKAMQEMKSGLTFREALKKFSKI